MKSFLDSRTYRQSLSSRRQLFFKIKATSIIACVTILALEAKVKYMSLSFKLLLG